MAEGDMAATNVGRAREFLSIAQKGNANSFLL